MPAANNITTGNGKMIFIRSLGMAKSSAELLNCQRSNRTTMTMMSNNPTEPPPM
jgi:hypothetical protein